VNAPLTGIGQLKCYWWDKDRSRSGDYVRSEVPVHGSLFPLDIEGCTFKWECDCALSSSLNTFSTCECSKVKNWNMEIDRM
jgi:hypothetical protein